MANILNGVMQEIAYFDTYPQDNGNQLTSAWSTYPYFDSVNILITDYEKGLFVVSMTSSVTSAPSICTPSTICYAKHTTLSIAINATYSK